MTVFRAIRIQMPDRPGALSAISTALAAHQVDIVRLDVVSHGDGMVVDDLLLSAESAEDIGAAVGGFYSDVTVRTFDEVAGDPVLEMGRSMGKVASSGSVESARGAVLEGAVRTGRADDALLLRMTSEGEISPLAASADVPTILPSEPFAGRWVLERRAAAAFPVAGGWAPQAFQHALSAAWVALAPANAWTLLMVTRRLNIPFYPGELERLSAFAEASCAITAAVGDPAPQAGLPNPTGATLPPRAVTLAARLPTA